MRLGSSIVLALDLALISTFASPTPRDIPIRSDHYFRLTNNYLTKAQALDVNPDGSGNLMMAATGAFSGQYWQFQASYAGTEDTVILSTLYLGPGMVLEAYQASSSSDWRLRMAPLDGSSAGSRHHLRRARPFAESAPTGQRWKLPLLADGTYQFVSDLAGSSLHLDTYSDTHQLFLGDGDHSGQHWTITDVRINNESFFSLVLMGIEKSLSRLKPSTTPPGCPTLIPTRRLSAWAGSPKVRRFTVNCMTYRPRGASWPPCSSSTSLIRALAPATPQW